MFRKIKKLIFHPNWYLYDYFRKKLGFRRYFVTDKIRLLDISNHQKWHKLLLSHPFLYLYYKFNKKLQNPEYPILVDYRIVAIDKNVMGGGECTALSVELESNNIIYFTDHEIIKKVNTNKEPNLSRMILKFNFHGNHNSVVISARVKFGRLFKINIFGDNNRVIFGCGCALNGGMIELEGSANYISMLSLCTINANTNICFKGDGNILNARKNVTLLPGSTMIFKKNNNYAYLGDNTTVTSDSTINFVGSNALVYICGNSSFNFYRTEFGSNTIFFYGYSSHTERNSSCSLWESKNIIIGSGCMFSRYIHLRNAAGHAIYDANTKKRISKGQSMIIGDHVWLGRAAVIIKGVKIGDGVMIGGSSLVTKDIPSGCMAAGHPAKVIREHILWTGAGPNNSETQEQFDEFEVYSGLKSNYKSIGWERLIKIDSIHSFIPSKEKVEMINSIINN